MSHIVVGPPGGPMTDGTKRTAYGTRDGSVATSDAHARYTETQIRKRLFTFTPNAAIAFAANLAPTAAQFGIWNPTKSGVIVSLVELIAAITAAPAAGSAIAIAGPDPTGDLAIPSAMTAATERSALWGDGTRSKAKAFTALTVPASAVLMRAMGGPVAAAAITPPYYCDPIDGKLGLYPGSWCMVVASTAISLIPTITWEELQILQ